MFNLGLAVQLVCFHHTEQPVCHCEYPRDVLFSFGVFFCKRRQENNCITSESSSCTGAMSRYCAGSVHLLLTLCPVLKAEFYEMFYGFPIWLYINTNVAETCKHMRLFSCHLPCVKTISSGHCLCAYFARRMNTKNQ